MKLDNLEKEIGRIYKQLIAGEKVADQIASSVHPTNRLSAKNLYRYLILRTYDLRKIHDSLSELGVSSLRTGEGYVLKNISNVLKIIKLLQWEEWEMDSNIECIGYVKSKKLLRKHSNTLFNSKNKKHLTEIMVTMPTEASEDLDLLRRLVLEGMEIARINLSHDDEAVWEKMVNNLKKVRRELDLPIKIYMDLSGPKIRTNEIAIEGKKNKKGKIKNFIKIKEGEHLIITTRATKGKPSIYGEKNELLQYAEVGVSLPQIIEDIQIGDDIFFDDGMIEAKVLSKRGTDAELVITKAYKSKLGSSKGINLPNTALDLPSLTKRDIELLPFVVKHADIVGYSFVRNAEDVKTLYHELEKLGNKEIGVVFKIENKNAFTNLPLILFEAMKRPKIGVMIARGDLAVEIGFERISEVQNQIMWFCEAAHIPVIWATQVLENLAKTGMASRAEISDAAISAQAECVMLNKRAVHCRNCPNVEKYSDKNGSSFF